MAHEINRDDTFGEVRANGQRAWHGLGMELPEGLSAVEAFKQVGLGWDTEMCPLHTEHNGVSIQLPDHFAHVRSDTGNVLGVVTKGYKPMSNKELAQFADALVGADQQVVTETAGSLRSGRVIFSLVKLPQDIAVADEDILKQYVLIRNSHDGSSAFQVYPTSVRVVCMNTLRWSEQDSQRGIKFRHQGDIDAKIEQARYALGLVMQSTKEFEAKVRILAAKNITAKEAREYFRAVYDACFGIVPELGDETPEEEAKRIQRQIDKRDKVLKRWDELMGADNQQIPGISGTAWAAYNAVSEWQDHERGRYLDVNHSEARVHSNLFGVADMNKRVAFNKALQLA